MKEVIYNRERGLSQKMEEMDDLQGEETEFVMPEAVKRQKEEIKLELEDENALEDLLGVESINEDLLDLEIDSARANIPPEPLVKESVKENEPLIDLGFGEEEAPPSKESSNPLLHSEFDTFKQFYQNNTPKPAQPEDPYSHFKPQ